MTLEGLFGEGCIVFATDGQENTALLEAQEPVLEIRMGFANAVFAELDAFHSVLAENAAPERVIKVEDDGFVDLSLECSDDIG